MLQSELESSNLKRAAWENETLYVWFKRGPGGCYLNTPCHIYEGLVQADSPGKYHHENIVGKYQYKENEAVGEPASTS